MAIVLSRPGTPPIVVINSVCHIEARFAVVVFSKFGAAKRLMLINFALSITKGVGPN